MTTLNFILKDTNTYISDIIPAGTGSSITVHINFSQLDTSISNSVTIEGTIDENLGWATLDNMGCGDIAEITLNNIPSSQSIRFICGKEPVSGGYEINS